MLNHNNHFHVQGARPTAVFRLIDPKTRTVYVYRPGETTERLVDPRRVEGEPPVDSFVLEMAGIWNPDL